MALKDLRRPGKANHQRTEQFVRSFAPVKNTSAQLRLTESAMIKARELCKGKRIFGVPDSRHSRRAAKAWSALDP